MCDTCGCNATDQIRIAKVELNDSHSTDHQHDHTHAHTHTHADGTTHTHAHTHSHSHAHDHSHLHSHDHYHPHTHSHDHGHHHDHSSQTVQVESDILQQNNLLAARNRGYYEAKNILAINLVSSPGSGKTTLLEQTLEDLKDKMSIAVIEGDQQTEEDGKRIAKKGIPVVQINTGKGCHLDGDMVYKATRQLQPEENSILFIENVGNLVCPALFDLGEQARAVIVSVTEGADKPLKYPDMFISSQLCLINKIDLLPYVPFDVEDFRKNALRVNSNLEFIEVSAWKNTGMDQWYEWLQQKQVAMQSQ